MRVLVTGANGLLGSRLCLSFLRRGDQVFGVSRSPTRPPLPPKPIDQFTYQQCDLTDQAQLVLPFEAARPDVVVHPASMTDVDGCQRDPTSAYTHNVVATLNVANAARRLGCHLIHVSTDYVFDGEDGPYTEADLPNPRGAYAISKHIGEQAVQMFAPSFAIARTAVVYGWPAARRTNFGAWLVQSLKAGQPVRLFEDQWVSPSLADSVAAMMVELAERQLTGIWNICGASVVNRVTFGKMVCERFGFDERLLVPVKLKEANLPTARPRHAGLLTHKAARELSEKPLELAQAIERFHAAWLASSQQSNG